MRVLQRTRARADVLELVSYIASDNPKAAAALYDAYEGVLASLAQVPGSGRLYASRDPRLQGVRAVPVGRFRSYLLFYRRGEDTVEVLRVLHAARDIVSVLAADD